MPPAQSPSKTPKTATITADLTFSIDAGLLSGTVGGESISMDVYSGGRGGSTTKGAVDPTLANNPLKVGQKWDHKNVHGGPIPPGVYTIGIPSHHEHLGLSAALTPHRGNHMFGRDGFYIHGSGKHGSEGCIVPATPTAFQKLMSLLKKSHGGTLTVVWGNVSKLKTPTMLA